MDHEDAPSLVARHVDGRSRTTSERLRAQKAILVANRRPLMPRWLVYSAIVIFALGGIYAAMCHC